MSWKVWPGQPRRFGQIVHTESSGLMVAVPQIGHFFGGRGFRNRRPSRRCTSGAITCGITSPGRVTTTSRPRGRPSGKVLLVVERRGRDRDAAGVAPAEHREWEEPAGAPDVPDDAVELGGRGDRRNFQATPSAARDRYAELAPEAALVDLHDDAVDLEVEALAALLPPQAALDHLVGAAEPGDVAVHREAALAQPVELPEWVSNGRRAAPVP